MVLKDNDENGSKKVRQSLTLDDPGPSIDTIGTVTPVEDCKILLEGGIQFAAVVVQMENVIIKLLSDSLGDQFNDKIQKCIEIYRQTSLEKKNSAQFNYFVSELKQTLISQKGFSLWQKLVDENLTLISSLEDSGSKYSDNDVLEFGKIELTKQVAEENDDDLVSVISNIKQFRANFYLENNFWKPGWNSRGVNSYLKLGGQLPTLNYTVKKILEISENNFNLKFT